MTLDEAKTLFHDHLDKCAQCEKNPFDLCEVGQIYMKNIELSMPNPIFVKPETPADWEGVKIGIDPSKKEGHVTLVNEETGERVEAKVVPDVEPPDPRGVNADPVIGPWMEIGMGKFNAKSVAEMFQQEYPGDPDWPPKDYCKVCGHPKDLHTHVSRTVAGRKMVKWCRGDHRECDCMLYLDGTQPGWETMLPLFRTEDGYLFILFEGRWVDNTDPDLRDMSFEGDLKGPIDTSGERVSGRISCCRRDTDGNGDCPIHSAPNTPRGPRRRKIRKDQ